MNADELRGILDAHHKWTRVERGGIRADLCSSDLSYADLRNANLRNADLSNADLSYADLRDTDLHGAHLHGANLNNATYDDKTIWPQFQIVPESGPFWLWKKLRDNVLAQLEVPPEAGRVSSTGRKCRVEFARTVALYRENGDILPADFVGRSLYQDAFEYVVGKTVRPDKWDPDFRVECSHGIHGYLRRAEAAAHR